MNKFKANLTATHKVSNINVKTDDIPYHDKNGHTSKFIDELEYSDNIVEVTAIKLLDAKSGNKNNEGLYTFDVKFVGKENHTVGDFTKEFAKSGFITVNYLEFVKQMAYLRILTTVGTSLSAIIFSVNNPEVAQKIHDTIWTVANTALEAISGVGTL